VSSFPQEYTIRSITAGTRNLLNNNLVVGSVPVLVEIRIAHKNSASGVVRGTAINGTLGGPSSAERVELCCFPTGPAERIFAPLHADGSFEFTGVPPGHYTAELIGKSSYRLSNPVIDVADNQGISGIQLSALSPLVPTVVNFVFPLTDRRSDISILHAYVADDHTRFLTDVIVKNGDPIQTRPVSNTSLPANVEYTIRVRDLPNGYRVQSVGQMVDRSFERPQEGVVNDSRDGARMPAFSVPLDATPPNLIRVVIRLEKK